MFDSSDQPKLWSSVFQYSSKDRNYSSEKLLGLLDIRYPTFFFNFEATKIFNACTYVCKSLLWTNSWCSNCIWFSGENLLRNRPLLFLLVVIRKKEPLWFEINLSHDIKGLMQCRSHPIANRSELLQSYIKPLIYQWVSARKTYVHCKRTGVTSLHQPIDIDLPSLQQPSSIQQQSHPCYLHSLEHIHHSLPFLLSYSHITHPR